MSNDSEQLLKLVELLREAIRQDVALREKLAIGDKFRFVRDRMNNMLKHLEEKLPTLEGESQKGPKLLENEIPVYVYLFNTQGLQLRSWVSVLTPKLFYEYSINRPIYAKKEYVETLLRSKKNNMQHAYIVVAVEKEKIIETSNKDMVGNPVIKVKEGALNFNKMISFTHNDQHYRLIQGELVKI